MVDEGEDVPGMLFSEFGGRGAGLKMLSNQVRAMR